MGALNCWESAGAIIATCQLFSGCFNGFISCPIRVRIAGELEGRLVEGQIDRLVVTDDDVIVIDFKTGAPPESWQDAPVGYREQIADYVALLANTYPGRNIRGLLFYVEGPVLLEPERES